MISPNEIQDYFNEDPEYHISLMRRDDAVGFNYRHKRSWFLWRLREVRGRVLDIGCNVGNLGALLRAENIPREQLLFFGIDLAPHAVECAVKRGVEGATFITGSAMALPFEAEYFDAVTLVEVIEHIPDKPRAILEACRVLKPGGLLLLSTPNADCLPWRFDESLRLTARRMLGKPSIEKDELLSLSALKALLRSAGMEFVEGPRYYWYRPYHILKGRLVWPPQWAFRGLHKAMKHYARLEEEGLVPAGEKRHGCQSLLAAARKPIKSVNVRASRVKQLREKTSPANCPLVSVVMSVFNEEQYVQAAVESILQQTYENLELIIIDDYSTDRSMDICRKIRDNRIRIHVKTTEPRYLATSRNLGIQMAQGLYVAFQDADDISYPARIATQLRVAMENPGRRVVGCAVRRIEVSRSHNVILPETNERICRGFRRPFCRDTIISGAILGPRQVFLDVPYRTRFRYMQDWDQLLRMFENANVEFQNCSQVLYEYYIRPKGVVFQREWLDYNLFVRHCQRRRRRGRPEFDSLQNFIDYLHVSIPRWCFARSLQTAIRIKKRLLH